MKEENQEQRSSAPEEENQPTPSVWKRLLRKKWFFPAVYLAAAALILAFITWYQNPNDYAIDSDELGYEGVEEETPATNEEDIDESFGYSGDEEVTPVTAQNEVMNWPVTEGEASVVVGYFDDEASAEEQQEAMVEYENEYHPSHGMDFAREDGEPFDVLAALSGTVITSSKDPLLGNYVEVEHDDGLVTVYQSLEDVQVAEGDTVEQGDILGQAGRSVFRQELGVHFHFEVREDGTPVNPNQFLTQAEDSGSEAVEESETEDETETEESDADLEEADTGESETDTEDTEMNSEDNS